MGLTPLGTARDGLRPLEQRSQRLLLWSRRSAAKMKRATDKPRGTDFVRVNVSSTTKSVVTSV
jgi:hypothetical protein